MHSKQVIRLLNENNSEEVEENRTFSDNDDNVESNKTHNLLNDKEINNFLLEPLIKSNVKFSIPSYNGVRILLKMKKIFNHSTYF